MYIPKMSGRTLLFISSLVLLTICNSHPLFKDLELHEDVEVRHVSGRTLRSLNVPGKGFRFPNEMTFVIEKGDMRVPLNMFLDSRPREKAFSMITTRDENGIQRRHSFSTANYAFYHVRNNITTATMKVNCADNQPCTLTGRFNLDNQNYVIEPNTEAPKRTRFVSSHKTYKIRRNDSEKPPVDVVKRVTNKRSGVQDGKRNGEKRQTKNVADVVFEIELAYVVDNSVFDFFAPKHSTASAAIDEIVQLIEFYTFEMYLRFATLRPNLHIRPYPSTVVVFQRAEESTWLQTFTENGNEFADATGTLDNFKNWTKANQALLGQYDLAMTLTNMDLADQGDAANTKNTMGISYSVATDFGDPDTLLCAHLDPNNEFVPAAVSEFSKYGDMSGVVTHEDGHLLGLLHDDEVGCGTAANPEYYVMHSSLSVNILIEYADHPWKFSTCSQTALTSALQSLLDSTPAGSKSCVEETAFTYEDYITFVTQTESGFSTYDDLCQKFLNVNACTVQKPDEVCHKGVPCISPNGGCEMVTETHGLTCGTGMTHECTA